MPDLQIFLVDDHSFIREGLKGLIQSEPDMKVIGETGDGESALRMLSDCQPDIVVMDISMPLMNGVEASRKLKQINDKIKILTLSMHEDIAYLLDLLEVGVCGYVLKRSAPQIFIQALRAIAAGGTYLDPAIAAKVTTHFVRPPLRRRDVGESALSVREESVIRLIALGHTNKEVATRLDLSVKTAETYKARAMEKLQLSNRADLVRFAAANGWLTDN